jgi:hypothetical protein
MAKSNTSSVKTIKAEKIAQTGNQNKNSTKIAFSNDTKQEQQVVNARKGANLELAKAKAKKKAKLAKASKKKNKK